MLGFSCSGSSNQLLYQEPSIRVLEPLFARVGEGEVYGLGFRDRVWG